MIITDYKAWLDDLDLDRTDNKDFPGSASQEILKEKKSSPRYEIEFVEGENDWLTIRSKYNKYIKALRLSPRSLNAILCEMRTHYTDGKDIENEGDFQDALDRSKIGRAHV